MMVMRARERGDEVLKARATEAGAMTERRRAKKDMVVDSLFVIMSD